ncbi:unnamed protein product [Amoebophrya sp. A120]|nr:unnamed protein product [Amoebophrya sp. A120]|eukprot:GSA120T00001715001.1
MSSAAGGKAEPRGSPPQPPTASASAKIRVRNFSGEEHSVDVDGLVRVRDLSQPRILQMFFQGDELIPPASLVHWTLVREDVPDASDGGDSKGEQGPAPAVLPKNDAEMTDSELVIIPEDPDLESVLPLEEGAEDSDAMPDCFLGPDAEIDVDNLAQVVYQFGVGRVSYDLKRQSDESNCDWEVRINAAVRNLKSVDEAQAFFYCEAHYCGGVESQEKLKRIRDRSVPSSAFCSDTCFYCRYTTTSTICRSRGPILLSKHNYNLVRAALNFRAAEWSKYHKAIGGEFFSPSFRDAFCWSVVDSAIYFGSRRRQAAVFAVFPPDLQEITAEDCHKLLRRALAALTEDGKNIDARRAATWYRSESNTTFPRLPQRTRAQVAEGNQCYLYHKTVLERVASTGQIPALTSELYWRFRLHECVLPDCKRNFEKSGILPLLGQNFFRDKNLLLNLSAADVIDVFSRRLKRLSSTFDSHCDPKIRALEVIEYIIRYDLEMECDLAPTINPLQRFAGLTTAQRLQESGLTFEYYRQLVREIERPEDEDFVNRIPWTEIENLWRTVE